MTPLIFTFYPNKENLENIINEIKMNPQIKFVSLVAVDLGNNHTDVKIPIEHLTEDYEDFLKSGIQTDGSSVTLPCIAEVNNGKVDLIPDTSVKWFVDYNWDYIDPTCNLPVGTLIIPAFIRHEGQYVGSRAILKRAVTQFESEIMRLLTDYPAALSELGLADITQIKKIDLTVATELEFWVKTPDSAANVEELSTSQSLKEQYWKRTVGKVRSALEKALLNLKNYDYKPEMGHKEVGGIQARLKKANDYSHVMEQLEIDWRFDTALQSADNEMFARDIISDTFVRQGLEVSFRAKPIENVAGSGEHHHIGATLTTTDGKIVNLFAAQNGQNDFLNALGYGALMGILNNYEVINPFITSTNDAFKRLKPGFEAPICIVGSLGHSVAEPSRNRTVLIGLVRDNDNPLATRFELRSPNPMSNSYLVVASVYQCLIDGIAYALKSGHNNDELLAELTKSAGQSYGYLATERQYICENDIFDDYQPDERDRLFGKPPVNVYQNLTAFKKYAYKHDLLKRGAVFSDAVLASYEETLLSQWATELRARIIPEGIDLVRQSCQIHQNGHPIDDIDEQRWQEIEDLRHSLMKDTVNRASLFSQIKQAINEEDYETVSELQIAMSEKLAELNKLYQTYKYNLMVIE